jgi:adenylate cyclase
MENSTETDLSAGARGRMPWCANPFVEWLLAEGAGIASAGHLIDGLCRRLRDGGIPLWRLFLLVRTLHPEVFAISYTWRLGEGVRELAAPHGVLDSALHRESPCAALFDGAAAIRRRLDVPEPKLDFPVLRELSADGATDYVAMPLSFSDGQINVISVTADRAGGFTTAQLAQIEEMLPALARLLELQNMRRVAATLLETYLGRQTGERVLRGLVRRGDGENVRAVIWFCDLRDSAALASSMTPQAFLGVLNAFFDCMVGAILERGGEVLRFIGDAVLAIFPTARDWDPDGERCCSSPAARANALAAARDAWARMDALNEGRRKRGEAPLRFGLALHEGDVFYGNIGVPGRLEFTVIGNAANEAARIEALCKTLDQPILVSAALARRVSAPWISLGSHVLRGVSEPQEIFALPRGGPSPGGAASSRSAAPAAEIPDATG